MYSTVLVGSTSSRVESSQLLACLIEWRDGGSTGTIAVGNTQVSVNVLQHQNHMH